MIPLDPLALLCNLPAVPRFASRLSTIFFALALALAGCGRNPDRAELVLINGAEPELFDPPLITAQATSRISYALFEGLAQFDSHGVPQPGVAERWTISPDGLTYTFFLRKNAVWSNGDPITTADFLFSWRRTLLPSTTSEYAYQLYYIKGAKDFGEGKSTDFSTVGVRALDPFTLQVTLENPTPFFLDLCAFSTLLPVHRPTTENFPDWASKPAHFIGNGAFLLKEWRPFDRVRLTKNPRYWNASAVQLQSVDIIPTPRPHTAFNFYSTGLADLMMDKGLAPTPLLTELKKRPDFHSSPFLGSYFIRFNVTRKPFDDPRVRKAFCLVLDKEYLVKNITRAGETAATSFVPPGAGSGYTPPPGLSRNLDEARRLLAEAGFPNGLGFPVRYYLYRADSDLDRDIAVELQSTLKRELGITVQLAQQEYTVYLNSQSKLDYDLSRSTWVGDYNDPNTFLDMLVTGGGNNRTGWSNLLYDKLIADAAKEVDLQKRYAIFRQAEQIILTEDPPICPLYYFVGIQLYDDTKLGGIDPNLLDEHPLKSIFWKKPR